MRYFILTIFSVLWEIIKWLWDLSKALSKHTFDLIKFFVSPNRNPFIK
jgi:hypothetical protein